MVTKSNDVAIQALKNRIIILRQSLKPIEDKIKHLETAIEILDSERKDYVQEPLQVVTYPNGNEINLKFLWAVTQLGRYGTKNDLLSMLKGREAPPSYGLIVKHSMHTLQSLVRQKKLVMVRYNGSNLLSFYGFEKWLAMGNVGNYYIMPNYEPAKVHLAKIIRESAEFRGLTNE